MGVRLGHGGGAPHRGQPRQGGCERVPRRRGARNLGQRQAGRADEPCEGASSLPCPPLAGYPLRHRGGDKRFAPGFKFLLKRAFAIGRRKANLADSALLACQRDLERRLVRLLAIEPDTKAGLKLRRGIEKCRDKSCSSSLPAAMCRPPIISPNGACVLR